MSRKKLKELTLKELEKLFRNNEQFSYQIWEDAYEDNMYWQSEEYEAIFGKGNKVIRYHDHYDSFYLTIADHERFVDSICDTDYLTTEARELYDKAKQLSERWQNMDYDEQDRHPELYEAIEQTNTKLLSAIEGQLHEHEHTTDDQVAQKLQDILDDMNHMADWEVDENGLVYQHIEKVYK